MVENGPTAGAGSDPQAGPRADPFLLLCLFVVGLSLNLGTASLVPSLLGVTLGSNPTAFVYTVLSAQVALGAVFLYLVWRALKGRHWGLEAVGLRLGALRRDLLFGVAAYIRVLPLVVAAILTVALVLAKLGVSFERSAVQEMAAESVRNAASVIAFAAMASVVAPILEETLFRGLLFTALREWLGFWPAGMVSAACFAMMHAPASRLPTAVLGMALARMYERSGSLVPAIGAHALHNALFYGALLLASR